MLDNLSPLDSRYRADNPELWQSIAGILSEKAGIRYYLNVERALTETLAEEGVCHRDAAAEIAAACGAVTAEEVLQEEATTRHNIRALVNCIQAKVSPAARPFVHLTATSVDIMDTARALQLRDMVADIILPQLQKLMQLWIDLARREADTAQVGRTHGQHGVPITFGFAVAEYISRLGGRIEAIRRASSELRGKMAGAVGAYNASSLLVADPIAFEKRVLNRLGLRPGDHSTQLVEPEYAADLFHAVVSAFGVLANFADDIRHLQRTEIGEVGEEFAPGQVGSSTMPHKRNPWNYENIKSMWKTFTPRMMTVYMDQISEHQRDLSNSASGRFALELLAGFALTVARTIRVTAKLSVNREQMQKNLESTAALTAAEPLYILLAAAGHPDAHEYVRQLTLQIQTTGTSLLDAAASDPQISRYWSGLTAAQRQCVAQPASYQGIAAKKTRQVCAKWQQYLEGMQ